MGNTINYGEMSAICHNTDAQCIEELSVGTFLTVLDYVTAGEMDGIVSDAQIKGLLTSDGRLIDACLEMVGKKFNELSPNGMQIERVPFARDFKDFLLTNHRGVYNSVFGSSSQGSTDETPTLSNVELAKRVATNLRRLAGKLDSVSKGAEQTIHQQDYFVNTYSNGFELQESLSPSFVEELGGPANAERAKALLESAFTRFSSGHVASDEPCDKLGQNGSVYLSGCYASTAQNLRQLASTVERMNPS